MSANKVMIQQAFRKCEIFVPINRSTDSDIRIEGLPEYTFGDTEEDEEPEEN